LHPPRSGARLGSTITLSLPSWSSASLVPRIDPSASPSGFSCVVSVKRSLVRIASTTAARSLAVVWGELIDQLRHPDPALNRRIVFEGQLRRPLHAELTREPRLEHRMGSLYSLERRFARLLRAEDGNEHPRVSQVGRRLDSRDRDKPDPRILELTDSLGQHLPDGFVHAAHPIRHARYSSGCTFSFSSRSPPGASRRR